MIDGYVFRIIVPLDDNYSFDAQIGQAENKAPNKAPDKAQIKHGTDYALIEILLMEYVAEHPKATQLEIAEAIGQSRRIVQNTILALKNKGLIVREGARKNGRWLVKRFDADHFSDR
jgi:ATP-dependent DNA helicase RecG